jgi:phospholipase C
MPTRRDFIKQAAFLSAAGAFAGFPDSIRRAMAIEPKKGTSFLDAEHVVILMQENRSFDHTFGALRGVRGFDDPRAIRLPDGSPVWAQPNSAGERFLPFRLDINRTKATWMGSLPHSWSNQVDARNNGRYDRWLEVKHSGDKEFARMPLTMGYYTREDIPFYYALADAFTVCDQNFCSSLTGTTPNRLHLWTGTIRPRQSPDSPAHVYNEDVDYGRWANWPTFPERLEDLGVSWKIYQNEISLESGLPGEHDAWLANFGDNPIEWFTQYNVRFAATHRNFVRQRLREFPGEIKSKEGAVAAASGAARDRLARELDRLRAELDRFRSEETEFSDDRLRALSERDRRLHERAFTVNSGDQDFRELAEIRYHDGSEERRLLVPKGDVLHQFRKDVGEGKLPAVSWIVPPERFSDHPSSPWYGAWYLSEVFDILTKNPRVWEKTVFILTYDENDGYFDHAPPFVAPDPRRQETGRVSKGIDAALEFVTLEQDRPMHGGGARESSIGLGYRVPMVIASPWSRGGCVCSQVFDHTSVLQFLEKLLSHRLGKRVTEPNINQWRRTVCGDLSAAFSDAETQAAKLPEPLQRDPFVEQIHRAQFTPLPADFRPLTDVEIDALRRDAGAPSLLPRQEPGLRRSCPLPYELFVTGAPNAARSEFRIRFEARRDLFGSRAAGAPFVVYAMGLGDSFTCRDYAVEPGELVEDSWPIADFAGKRYHLRVYGPNGYFREFVGDASDPGVQVDLAPATYSDKPADARLVITSGGAGERSVRIRDNAYGNAEQTHRVVLGSPVTIPIPAARSHGWYDVSVLLPDAPAFERRLAGRVENGSWGFSDPAIGARA